MRKIDYAITGSEYETTKAPEWDEPIVLDMTDARIGAHYVSGAVIKYLYDRFGSRIYTKKYQSFITVKP